MSALEVLQTCPSQRNSLLSSLGVSDDISSSMIKFETHGIQPYLHYYVSILIHVECLNNTIMRTVIDKGASASVMSFSCWNGLGSPMLSQFSNMLAAFDGRSFQLHGTLPSLEVQLGGNIITIEVKVVDVPLDYNIYWVGIQCIVCMS